MLVFDFEVLAEAALWTGQGCLAGALMEGLLGFLKKKSKVLKTLQCNGVGNPLATSQNTAVMQTEPKRTAQTVKPFIF